MKERTTENNLPMPITLALPLHLRSTVGTPNLFLKDPGSDMFIMVDKTILPIHASYCFQSQLIRRHWLEGHKFCLLPSSIQIKVVTSILQLFYGSTLTIHNYRQLHHTLQVLKVLEMECLRQIVEEELMCLTEDSDIFSLLSIAYQHELQQLFNSCFQTLLAEQFEQMLYNKYDFMHCQFQLFQIVLRLHYRLQQKGKITGVHKQEVEEIIKLYSTTNGYDQRTCMNLLGKYGSDALKQKIRTAFEKEEEKNIEQMEEYLKNVEDIVMMHDDDFCEEGVPIQMNEKDNLKDFFLNENAQSKISIQIDDQEESPRLSPAKTSYKRNRKFSEKVDGLLKPKQKSFAADYRSQNLKERREYLLNLQKSIQEEKQIYPQSAGNPIEVPQLEDDEDADELVGKISHMLDQYRNAYEKHETNFNTMKRKQTMQSAIFKEGTQTNYTASRRFYEGTFGRPEIIKNKDQQILSKVGRNVFDTQRLDDCPTMLNIPTL